MDKLLVILGPTATGKTDLALNLAKKYDGELVACDSRQVYKGLDIGTGKEPGKNSKLKTQNSKFQLKMKKFKNYWEVNEIKIWMYDVVEPNVQFNVKNYVEKAEKVIEDILKRDKLPIIVGGTGLYLKALLEGMSNLDIPVDEKLRGELEELSLRELQEKLQDLSPAKWKSLNASDQKNPRRLLRAIELLSMYPYVNKSQNSKIKTQKYNVLKIGLTAPRLILNNRIDARVLSRIDQGMIEEAESLYRNSLTLKRMKELGLEYGVLADLLSGKINLDEFVKTLSTKIHQYAKRQITWFKKEKDINWFDITEKNWAQEVEKKVDFW